MYAISWAETRRKELFLSHTRATEFLMKHLSISTDHLTLWLANGEPEWEYFKFLIRMIENAAGIRKKPNDLTTHLYSEQLCRVLRGILHRTTPSTPLWELTARASFGTLKEHECVRGEASIELIHGLREASTGQLDLFEGAENG